MKCLLCQTDKNNGRMILKKNECFVLLCSTNPEDYEHYSEQTTELKKAGWKEEILCDQCYHEL